MNKIELKSRYGDIRVIEEIDNNTLKITGKSNYTREIFDKDENGVHTIQAIDFEGGPYIGVGTNIGGYNITGILYDQENKHYILKGEKVKT
jgi:hypothetical protein